MKHFLTRIFIFLLPCTALFLLPFLVFFASGEFLPLSTVIQSQQSKLGEALYLPGLTSAADLPYKIGALSLRNPEIIVFGTSRTLTIKSSFFNNPSLFYNSGYTAGRAFKAQDLLSLINEIPKSSNLKVILFDASSFLKKEAEGKQEYGIPYSMAHTFFTAAWRDTYLKYLKGEFSIAEVLSSFRVDNDIGFRPRLYGIGYRKDGSLERNIHKDKNIFYEEVKKNIQSDLSFIVPGHGGFSDYDDTIPHQNINTIDTFLASCKARGIYVIGYFSPNAQEIHEKMISLQDGYGDSYRSAPKLVGDIFEKNGYNFYDIQDLRTIGSSDREMYDPHHPTEKGTIRLLMFLLNHEPKLKIYLNEKELQKKLENEPF
jgi:hypothetical protein